MGGRIATRVVAALAAGFLAHFTAAASCGIRLIPGDVRISEISSDEDTDVFTFEGMADGVVSVRVSSTDGALEPGLELYEGSLDSDPLDLEGVLREEGGVARIRSLTLGSTGTYYLVVRGKNDSTGEYSLRFRGKTAPASTGGVVAGAGGSADVTFEGLEDGTVSFWVRGASGPMSRKPDLFDPSGSPVFGAQNRMRRTPTGWTGAKIPLLGAAGTYVLRVYAPPGTSLSVRVLPGFQAGRPTEVRIPVLEPVVTGVDPSTIYQGQPLSVNGANLARGARAWFTSAGGTVFEGTVESVADDGTSLLLVAPGDLPDDTYTLQVCNPEGQGITWMGGTIEVGIQVSGDAVSPTSGPISGGTQVTVTGAGFSPEIAVSLVADGGSRTSVPVDSVSGDGTTLRFTTPPHAAGLVDFALQNPGGTEVAVQDAFRFTSFSVTGSSPPAGPVAGGTTVTVTGVGFDPAIQVFLRIGEFGALEGPLAGVVVDPSGTTLTFPTPAHAAGYVHIVLMNPGGATEFLADAFHYADFAAESLSPTFGPATGGTTVTVYGVGFQAGLSIRIQVGATGTPTDVDSGSIVVSPDGLTVTFATPAFSAGTVYVILENPSTETATLPDSFTFTDESESVFLAVSPPGSTLPASSQSGDPFFARRGRIVDLDLDGKQDLVLQGSPREVEVPFSDVDDLVDDDFTAPAHGLPNGTVLRLTTENRQVAVGALSVDVGTSTFRAVKHNLQNGNVVRVTSSDTLPEPLVVGTDYYVVGRMSDTFQVSATSGGAPVTLTTQGDGTHVFTLWSYPPPLLPGTNYYVVNAQPDSFQLSTTEGGTAVDLTGQGLGIHRFTARLLQGGANLRVLRQSKNDPGIFLDETHGSIPDRFGGFQSAIDVGEGPGLAVGDLDGDTFPEIVCTGSYVPPTYGSGVGTAEYFVDDQGSGTVTGFSLSAGNVTSFPILWNEHYPATRIFKNDGRGNFASSPRAASGARRLPLVGFFVSAAAQQRAADKSFLQNIETYTDTGGFKHRRFRGDAGFVVDGGISFNPPAYTVTGIVDVTFVSYRQPGGNWEPKNLAGKGATAVSVGGERFQGDAVAIGDLDGDGANDLVISSDDRVFETRAVTFQRSSFSSGTYFRSFQRPSTRILLNTMSGGKATGIFAESATPLIDPSLFSFPDTGYQDGGQAEDIAIGDLNGDGRPDLVLAHDGRFELPNPRTGGIEFKAGTRIFVNGGKGTFTDATRSNMPTVDDDPSTPDHFDISEDFFAASRVALGDLDGDGDLDMVLCTASGREVQDGRPWTRILINRNRSRTAGSGPTGIFDDRSEANMPGPTGPEKWQANSLFLRDVDGDGDLDLLLASSDPELTAVKAGVRVLLNDGRGQFAESAPGSYMPAQGPTESWAGDLVLMGDLDGDLGDDIVISVEDPAVDPATRILLRK